MVCCICAEDAWAEEMAWDTEVAFRSGEDGNQEARGSQRPFKPQRPCVARLHLDVEENCWRRGRTRLKPVAERGREMLKHPPANGIGSAVAEEHVALVGHTRAGA
jgi:hypothetical protein